MTAWIKYLDDRSATAVLGAYLCFVGIKMLFLAWNGHRAGMKPQKLTETGVAHA